MKTERIPDLEIEKTELSEKRSREVREDKQYIENRENRVDRGDREHRLGREDTDIGNTDKSGYDRENIGDRQKRTRRRVGKIGRQRKQQHCSRQVRPSIHKEGREDRDDFF